MTLRLAIVAGEHSGDILGAGLIAALSRQYPGLEVRGIGGPRMIKAGCQSVAPMDRLSVMGFVEPLGRLPELLLLKRKLAKQFADWPADVFIGIDSPDFNLRLASSVHGAGIPVVHYVSPSVWAYRQKRIHGIKQVVDLMLTLFPFETRIYRVHGIAVKCVGHPLADQIGFEDRKPEARAIYELPESAPVVALLPGSRGGEIKRLFRDFLAAALIALQANPGLRFLIPASGSENRLRLMNILREESIFLGDQFQVVDDSHQAMTAADFVVTASGTATLEATLLKRPMVVCYRLAALTYKLASRMVNIEHVALPNLLAGEELVPEYIQDAVDPEIIAREIVSYFNGERDYADTLTRFGHIHHMLRKDASRAAAKAVAEFLDKRGGASA